MSLFSCESIKNILNVIKLKTKSNRIHLQTDEVIEQFNLNNVLFDIRVNGNKMKYHL